MNLFKTNSGDTREMPRRSISNGSQRPDPIESSLGPFGCYQIRIFICLLVGQCLANTIVPSRQVPPERYKYYCYSPDNYTDACSSDCSEIKFEKDDPDVSIITEWMLICGRAIWINHQYSAFLIGYLLGSLAMGNGADGCGRRPTFLLSCVGQFCFGCLLSVSPVFAVYCLFNFFVAFSTVGIYQTSLVLLIEMTGMRVREYVVVGFKLPFFLGNAIVPWLYNLERNWRIFNLYICMPCMLYILNFWVVTESPRWLFVTGELNRSVVILQKGARMNKRQTENIGENVETTFLQFQGKTLDVSFDMTDLFKHPKLRTNTLIIALNYICGFVTIPCMEVFWPKMHTCDHYHNTMHIAYVVYIVNVVGLITAVLLLKFLGRRKTQILVHIVLGVVMIATSIEKEMGDAFGVTVHLVALFCYTIDLITLDLYACEIFPTVVRSSGIGLCVCVVFLVKGLISLLPLVAKTHISIAIIFGVLCIASGGLCFMLPETKGLMLPDTIEDGETIGNSIMYRQRSGK